MRVVVADTTPIRYLAKIEHLDLLPQLFGTVFVPSVVYSELQNPAAPLKLRGILKTNPAWLKVVATDLSLLSLDEGEKAALILRLDLSASLILIDERKGTAVARQKGFETTGTFRRSKRDPGEG